MATITTTLAPLALLACPIGMGLMMLLMGKGMRDGKKDDATAEELSVEELREEQERLTAEVERLQREAADREVALRR